MEVVRTKITAGGRVVIPATFRKALGVCPGDTIVLQLDDGEVRMFTVDHAIKRAQEMVSAWVPGDRSLVDELIAERRSEAARE